MTERLDFNSFAGKFGQWADKFKPFIEGKEMWDIMQKIKADSAKETIVPASRIPLELLLPHLPLI